ncbi:GGDEF domain-containing protein [Hydrogenimonas sp.]
MKITRQFDLVLKFGIAIMTLLSLAMIYLYFQVDKVLTSTRQEMVEMIVDRYQMELVNAARLIDENVDGKLLPTLRHDKQKRNELQKLLSFFKTPEIENLFVVVRDEKGRYRYLLDSEEDAEKRAMFMQRFEPVSDVWDRTYDSRKKALHKHIKNGQLWLTLTVPMVENGELVAVLGSDLSAKIRSDVEKRFNQIKSIMFGVAAVIVMMLVFGYVQIFYYFRGRKKSFIDPLTGAYNRKFLYEVLANGNFAEYQIIMYDVDHFKRVNDTYGHDVGDEVLKVLTARIQKMLREEDYLIRFGGEEFIIFLHAHDPEEAKEVALRIKKSIETSPFVIGDNILSLTISLGINSELYRSSNIDDAIEAADEQLYCAKNSGRNRVCFKGDVVS